MNTSEGSSEQTVLVQVASEAKTLLATSESTTHDVTFKQIAQANDCEVSIRLEQQGGALHVNEVELLKSPEAALS